MTMRIGGVPEHFNLPWQEALADHSAEWVEFGGGSGAMARALSSGELDVAVMLTESAVRAVSAGLDARIVGTHVHSPLRWGIHASAGSSTALSPDARFAISRPGSGSHLIPCVVAHARGWDVDELQFVEVGTIAGGQQALLNGTADLFFWEQFMTQPLVDNGGLTRLEVFLPPWPSFVVVASPRAGDLRPLIAAVEASCKQRRDHAGETVDEINERFHISEAHAREWLSLTDWRCTSSVSATALQRTSDALARAFGVTMPMITSLIDPKTCTLAD